MTRRALAVSSRAPLPGRASSAATSGASRCRPRAELSFVTLVRRTALRERIDPLEGQVRLYPTTAQTFAERYIIGARTIEERSDYRIAG